ncbi:MAG TPA: hypothetical protein VGW33_09285 [Terriglobia bacterium]|nr:hypothetical protein [Terriglobia bacterium]
MTRPLPDALLSALTALLLVLAGLTILPRQASQPDLLGYRTLCAFVPLSTIILLGLAGFVRALRNTLYRGNGPVEPTNPVRKRAKRV